ncbi:MAG: hypothetical protein [Circular genetic element sp.]|nr:MAG: hypothetical protein [Circular genetic element sp.]
MPWDGKRKATWLGVYKPSKKGRKSVVRRKQSYRRRTPYVRPMSRLKGFSPMPYFKMSRAYDGAKLQLCASQDTMPGFQSHSMKTFYNEIPGASALADIYRFFRLKSISVEYTPTVRTDAYINMFKSPLGPPGTAGDYQSKGSSLEMKFLNYYGASSNIAAWDECLNKAGTLRKCPTTTPFRVKRKLYVHNELNDDQAGADPYQCKIAPWLSTDNANNLSLDHYFGIICAHVTNNVSYDNAQPVWVLRRYVMEVEFKGLKV